MIASLSSLCSRWLWQPFPELLVMLSGLTQNKTSMIRFAVFTFTLALKEDRNTHVHQQTNKNKQKDIIFISIITKKKKGCTNMLCVFCQGSAMNFIDIYCRQPILKPLIMFSTILKTQNPYM